jgi:hypothetical protein
VYLEVRTWPRCGTTMCIFAKTSVVYRRQSMYNFGLNLLLDDSKLGDI